MNPEDFELPECCPRFSADEMAMLKAAGFGALMPYNFARFRVENIENISFRTKVFLRKRSRACGLSWYLRICKANDLEIISDSKIERCFPTVQAALDWLGAFAGQRSYPVPSPDSAPACGPDSREELRQADQPAPADVFFRPSFTFKL